MWNKVVANSNLIQTETERAVLIKLPKSEFKFWHPRKLVRCSGKSGYRMSISFTEEFTFKLFKNGKGNHNSNTKIEEREMNSEQLMAAFGAS